MRVRALISKNPSHCYGLQRRHLVRPIQRQCMLTINPVVVTVSFEACVVGSGIKDCYGHRHYMVSVMGNHAACFEFKRGFGRR